MHKHELVKKNVQQPQPCTLCEYLRASHSMHVRYSILGKAYSEVFEYVPTKKAF